MTTTEPSVTGLRWDPPGPGSWTLEAEHYPRPLTAALRGTLAIWSEATTGYLRAMGMPIEAAEMVAVHGVPYVRISDGGGGSAAPPAWLYRILVRVVPTLRRTEAHVGRYLEQRPWNEAIRRWYDQDRPEAEARIGVLAAVEPRDLVDVCLADHLEACHEELERSLRQHLAMHAHDFLPAGLLAVRMLEWGFALDEAWELLAGASPASTGDSPELTALRAAVAGRSAGSMDELRGLGAEVAVALDAFLARHGWRAIDGYDLDARCLAEVPALVVRLATTMPGPDRTDRHEALVAAARDRVPEGDRPEFERLLREGRAAYGLRDDNSSVLTSWPVGVLRRATLATGERLVSRGLLADPLLAVEATTAELAAVLRGQAGIDADELARRADHRRSLRAADAPRTLGPPEAPLPEHLPGAFGHLMRVFALTIPERRAHRPLEGLGIGSEAHQGRVRLIVDPAGDLGSFEPGDVLVAPATSPSFNVLLALAGAVVTEEGDAMSHAAIMARELGIPAVVGAPEATVRLHDGDLVVVDPTAGAVRLLTGP